VKQPKKPTYQQKKEITSHGLDPREWMVRYEDNILITLIHKDTKEVKEIWKK